MSGPPEGWAESTEGDLDADLTEEAGYSGWDPPRRRDWLPIAAKAVSALVLLAMASGLILQLR